MQVNEHLQAILDTLPDKPGCYLMKNAQGRIIYVGKAVNLRARVRSYFHAGAHEQPKTQKLVSEIADIEWIVVGSELEALILEMNLIKRHRPRYNVRLKDDKRFPISRCTGLTLQDHRHPPDGHRWLAISVLHQRVGGAPNVGPVAQDLSLPDLQSRNHGQDTRVFVLRHQTVFSALYWRHQPGGLPPVDRRFVPVPRRTHETVVQRLKRGCCVRRAPV